MGKYKLYLSGLYFGNIEFQNGKAYHEKWDVCTGKLENRRLADSEDCLYYKSTFNLDVAMLASKMGELTAATVESLSKGRNKAETSSGLCFEKWEKENPYELLQGQTAWVQRGIKFPWDFILQGNEIISITIPARERITVLSLVGAEENGILKQWQAYTESDGGFLAEEEQAVAIEMRDGVRLSTLLLMPKGLTTAAPTILIRTPYGKNEQKEIYYPFVRRGYVVAVQDVRGREDSEGVWKPMIHEVEDGDDTLNWIGAQSWSNGKVGMIGGSYLGFVQWAAAASGNPYLQSIVSFVTAGGPFVDLPRKGGTMSSGTLAWAFALSGQRFNPQLMIREDWDQVMKIRPLSDIFPKTLGHSVHFFDLWTAHENYDEEWEKMDWSLGKEKMKAPALIISGWYDDNQMGTTEALSVTSDFPKGKRKVILGPWVHSGNACRDIHGVPMGNNALRYDIDLIALKWMDRQLKGIENGIDETAPVEYYTMGSEIWQTAEAWPIPELLKEELYLCSNGSLCKEPEQEAGRDDYRYDPSDDTPYLIDVSENEFGVPGNYKEVDKRGDVLVYETEAFPYDRTVTGDIQVDFYGSSNAPDTNFIIKLEHVDQQGNAIKMADGMLAARYRSSFSAPEFMEQGKVYFFSILTGKISDTIFEGHKLRLTIASGAEGLCFPSSNTKEGYKTMETKIANNTIHFGAAYPSKAVVPFCR